MAMETVTRATHTMTEIISRPSSPSASPAASSTPRWMTLTVNVAMIIDRHTTIHVHVLALMMGWKRKVEPRRSAAEKSHRNTATFLRVVKTTEPVKKPMMDTCLQMTNFPPVLRCLVKTPPRVTFVGCQLVKKSLRSFLPDGGITSSSSVSCVRSLKAAYSRVGRGDGGMLSDGRHTRRLRNGRTARRKTVTRYRGKSTAVVTP